MFRIRGLSQSAFGRHKPNEDRWDYAVSPHNIVTAVADGVTQSPVDGDQYPRDVSWRAALLATRYVTRALKGRPPGPHDEQTLRDAVEEANRRIRQLNHRIGRWETINDRISTTLLVAWLRAMSDGGAEGYIASIGDPVGLSIAGVGKMELLTTDQLAECHRFSYTHFVPQGSESVEDARRRRHVWQREYARNNPDAVRPDDGNVHVGYGVLDGDPRALHFLCIRRVQLARGAKLLLASDALRALRKSGSDVESANDYDIIVDCVRANTVMVLPEQIVGHIREAEMRHALRSDDATVVVIETNV